MKKVIYSVAVLSALFIVACGPSKEDIEKKEKMHADSVATVEKSRQDSIMAADKAKMTADSLKMATEAKAKEDSIAKAAESAGMKKGAAAAKPKKDAKPEEKPKVKAGQGKG